TGACIVLVYLAVDNKGKERPHDALAKVSPLLDEFHQFVLERLIRILKLKSDRRHSGFLDHIDPMKFGKSTNSALDRPVVQPGRPTEFRPLKLALASLECRQRLQHAEADHLLRAHYVRRPDQGGRNLRARTV